MRKALIAAAVAMALALPAAAQQAPAEGNGQPNRSPAASTTGPESSNPPTGPTGDTLAKQPGTGRYVGGSTGAPADCPPGSSRPECQQASMPNSSSGRLGSSGASGSMGTSGGPADQTQYGSSQTKGGAH